LLKELANTIHVNVVSTASASNNEVRNNILYINCCWLCLIFNICVWSTCFSKFSLLIISVVPCIFILELILDSWFRASLPMFGLDQTAWSWP